MPTKTFVKKVNYDVLERAGMLPDVIKDEIENDKPSPSLFAYKWLGEPIAQSDTAILNRDNVLGSMQRDIEADGQIIVGVDVARMGGDRTVFWKRKGLKTISKKVFTKLRTTEICDQLERYVEDDKSVQIKVDDTGVGGGVTD
jgi:phage terminase large subunit